MSALTGGAKHVGGVSYAKAVSTQTHTASTQTDLTWPLNSKLPVALTNVVSRKTTMNCSAQTDDSSSNKKANSQKTSTKSNSITNKKVQEPSKKSSNRSRKGSNDPAAQYNKYGILDTDDDDDNDDDNDMEYEATRAKSASPRARKKPGNTSNNG